MGIICCIHARALLLAAWIQIHIWIHLLVLFSNWSNPFSSFPSAYPFLARFCLQPISSKSVGAPPFLWPGLLEPQPSAARGPAGPAPAAGHLLSHPPPADTDRCAPPVIPATEPSPTRTPLVAPPTPPRARPPSVARTPRSTPAPL
jgi:hypothetical protein